MDKDSIKDQSVSDLLPSCSTNVEGVFVGTLSPVKTGRKNSNVKYFEGQLSDGSKTVRFVSFEPKLRPQIQEAQGKSAAVLLKNCAVKRNREQALEVQVNSQTVITNSPTKFKIDEKAIKESESREVTTLEDLNDIAEHQSVSITGKVTSLFPVEKITIKSTGKELKKRDLFLSDHTAVYRCVAWESDIDVLQESNSYKITNATIRTFNGDKYLSIGQTSEIAIIEDIGEVIDDQSPVENSGRAKVITSDIVSVAKVDEYKSCYNCSSKLSHSDAPLIVCQKCNAKMKAHRCQTQRMADITLEDDSKRVYHVTIFNDILEKVRNLGKQVVGDVDIDDQLLSAPPLIYTINQKDIVSSVSVVDK